MKRLLVFSTVLITTLVNMVSLSAITLPTKTEADAYYKKWKEGAGEDKPGHIMEFEMPEPFHFSRVEYHDYGSGYNEDSWTGSWENIATSPYKDGTTNGAVVYMVGNGSVSEFSPGQDLTVSTDEAMGYGMMLAVLANDKELFDKLAAVVEYYEPLNEKYDQLTSWSIPAKSDGKFKGYDNIVKTVNEHKKNGWTYSMKKYLDGGVTKEYEHLPYYDWWAPKKPKLSGGKIVGQKLDKYMADPDKDIGPDNPASTATVSGIAMDGSLDIAFAFLMAWDKWVRGKENKKGEINYKEISSRRFTQIIQVCKKYGRKIGAKQQDKIEVLPLGDYNNRDASQGGANGLTRPSDWLVANLRSYYEMLQGDETRNLIGTLLDQMKHFSDEDENKFNPGVGPSNTGLVPDFAEMKGDKLNAIYTLKKKNGDKVVHEDNVTHFAVNAARVPFRQAMDYLLYGDEYSLNRAMALVDFIYKVPDTVTNNATDNPETDPFNVARKLNGNRVDPDINGNEYFYTNQVLKAAVMTTIAAANKAGITKYDSFYNNYIGSFKHFDSQYTTWNDSIGYTRTKGNETKTDKFEFKKDPAHSGYFEDSWTAMALYMMSGEWNAPHPYDNEFKDKGIDFNIHNDSKDYATLTKNGDEIQIKITKDPGNKKIVFVAEDFICLRKTGYSFMAAIKRENGKTKIQDGEVVLEPSKIDAKMFYKEDPSVFVKSKGELTITEDNITRGYMDGFSNVTSDNDEKAGRIEFTLNSEGTGLKKGTTFTFTKMGIYDPDVEKARYRYVDNWRSDEANYWIGDYVRYNLDTWVCVKDHDTVDPDTGITNTPGEDSEYWELSDYTLLGERWISGRFYSDADLVYYQGKTYIARVPFTSINPPPTEHANWMLYYDHNEGIASNWFHKGGYLVGDLVHFNGNIYRCTVQHTANAGWTPVTAFTLWEKVNHLFSNINPFPWEEWTPYETGAIVKFNGIDYECVIGHTSQPGWDPVSITTLWREK